MENVWVGPEFSLKGGLLVEKKHFLDALLRLNSSFIGVRIDASDSF